MRTNVRCGREEEEAEDKQERSLIKDTSGNTLQFVMMACMETVPTALCSLLIFALFPCSFLALGAGKKRWLVLSIF